jgi:hypothetical protein
MNEKKKKKNGWVRGVNMPEFSGTSWKDLEDIWPADVRVNSEAWKLLSVFFPAWLATKQFINTSLNIESKQSLNSQDLFVLCLIQRCEEARSNVAMQAWPALKAMNIGGRLWYARKAKLTKLGLIENMPAKSSRLYRLTGMGKLVIRTFIDNVEQAHKDIKYWTSLQPPEYAVRIDEYLNKYCYNYSEEDKEKAPE